ncbi:MAG: sensor histidine kinase [Thermoactinospora sp.]|nr:sensor histidine kinase [Thermoactinospora sp.]
MVPPPRRFVADLIIAAVVAAVIVLAVFVGQVDLRPAWPFGHVLLAAACALLVARTRAPVVVLALQMVLTWSYFLLGYPEVPVYLGTVVALYTVADLRGTWVALLFALAGVGGMVWQELADGVPRQDTVLIGTGLLLVVVAGASLRDRRVLAAESRRRAVAEERLRIARDLHDAVGHHLSLISVQAGAALLRFDERPDKAREALAAVKESSQEALRDLRGVVGELREGSPAGIRRLAATSPLEVELSLPELELPPQLGLTAYRIVQEALTNAARHSSASRARVALAVRDGQLVVSVTDDGAGEGGWVPGDGLRGMEERVRALGGSLRYGPGVLATLPLGEGA